MSTVNGIQVNLYNFNLDAVIVGAGLGGIYSLIHLRRAGLDVKVFEAGPGMGGIWYWNCYPGARVDSDSPFYQLTLPELYQEWNYTEKFPGWKELRDYFTFVDEKLDLKKDVIFNAFVKKAQWDSREDRWKIETADGRTARTKFLVLNTGVGSKIYVPTFKGFDKFKGECFHTARWPQQGTPLNNKRVGVIGTGATGVQIIQEVGPIAKKLVVFQRTPNLALPMVQGKTSGDLQNQYKADVYPALFKRMRTSFTGFPYDFINDKTTLGVPREERLRHYEAIWCEGGLRFWAANYSDMFSDDAANDEAYAFWRDKVRQRIKDPRLQEKLSPIVKPHPFGCKRPSLEQNYYEIFNQDNVELADVNEDPIEEITENGVKMRSGKEYELDMLALATGFDMVTGGITDIDIRGTDDKSIKEEWERDGLHTYLGMAVAKYPNLFFSYGPQGPTAFCNGPSCLEMQGEWIVGLIKYMIEKGYSRVEAEEKAEKRWREYTIELNNKMLFPKAKSWYMGANIPGKRVEPLNFTGGVPLYYRHINNVRDKGYDGFQFSQPTAAI